MDVDRSPHLRDFSRPCTTPARSLSGHQNLLLCHSAPRPQVPAQELCTSPAHATTGHSQEYFNVPRVRYPLLLCLHPHCVLTPLDPDSSRILPQAISRLPLLPQVFLCFLIHASCTRGDIPWGRGRPEYSGHHSQLPYYLSRSPEPNNRGASLMETSPHSALKRPSSSSILGAKPGNTPHPCTPPLGPS